MTASVVASDIALLVCKFNECNPKLLVDCESALTSQRLYFFF